MYVFFMDNCFILHGSVLLVVVFGLHEFKIVNSLALNCAVVDCLICGASVSQSMSSVFELWLRAMVLKFFNATNTLLSLTNSADLLPKIVTTYRPIRHISWCNLKWEYLRIRNLLEL